ncbi:substrate-binding domain-containing protein [Micrococcaceae bacterium Sec5.7]
MSEPLLGYGRGLTSTGVSIWRSKPTTRRGPSRISSWVWTSLVLDVATCSLMRPGVTTRSSPSPVKGLSIPKDLSIVGFDDIPAAEWIEPGLTTIRQPVVQMAEAATRALLRHLDGDEELPQRIELGTELVVRGSTAPPATG